MHGIIINTHKSCNLARLEKLYLTSDGSTLPTLSTLISSFDAWRNVRSSLILWHFLSFVPHSRRQITLQIQFSSFLSDWHLVFQIAACTAQKTPIWDFSDRYSPSTSSKKKHTTAPSYIILSLFGRISTSTAVLTSKFCFLDFKIRELLPSIILIWKRTLEV